MDFVWVLVLRLFRGRQRSAGIVKVDSRFVPLNGFCRTWSALTLGCRANKADTLAIAAVFSQAGLQQVPFGQTADLTVINTCTVTAAADRQSRQMINRAVRNSPEGLVVVMGCWARLRVEQTVSKRRIVRIPDYDPEKVAYQALALLESRSYGPLTEPAPHPAVPIDGAGVPSSVSRMSRPPLKVQDGCANRCAFCTVRLARGPQRSVSAEHVCTMLQRYQQQSVREVVLTGINLGSWGRDHVPRQRLPELLRRIRMQKFDLRVRLSSIEPQYVDADLLGEINEVGARVCPHLHLPLQSGSDEILKAMRRPYRAAQYADLIVRIRKAFPYAALGADVLCGFPGESERCFAETVSLVRSLPFSYLHVFPFSARPGTEAADLPHHLDRATARQRARVIRDIGRAKRTVFLESLLHTTRPALFEHRRCSQTGALIAMTDNYVAVRVEGPDALQGQLAPVEITALGPPLRGRLCR
jgi:threonylcarbamoyladenosine tRNA methylthiotransferase MtaB